MGQTALKAPFQLKPSYDEKKTTAYEGARSTRALRAPRDEIPQAELRAALVSGGEAPPIHAQRRAVRAQRRARSAARQGACLAPRRPPAPPARRPPVPTAAARRSPFASLPRPQRAMLTAPRRLLRLCSSTFRMGESASRLPRKEEALPGRSQSVPVADKHHVNGNRMVEPFPEGTRMAIFGMGCFWGAERKFWRQKGVYSTHVGYAGGYTPNPTYKEVCSGRTGHTEAVRVVYQPENISFEKLLKVFWENHDPTQGMRQGNDVGTQYRSAIYTFSQEQMEAALKSKEEYQKSPSSAQSLVWITEHKSLSHPSSKIFYQRVMSTERT
uniref:Mitochondrial peptide methionine sulfoxide reductase n=1 Tax=Phasianus colchicus TaxID=9054 RepID=A0A669Q740_PHACC